MRTIIDLIDSLADHGDREAVVAMTPEGCLSRPYLELAVTVHRLAAGLAAAGIGPDRVVALLAENRFEWLVAGLAAMRCGGVVLPLDTQITDDNLAHILKDSDVGLIFTNKEQAERLARLRSADRHRLALLDLEEGAASWRRLLAEADHDLPDRRPEDQAALFYTSGTTGPPKGVPLSHANLAFQVASIRAAGLVGEADRVLSPLPPHHVYPFVIGMLVPLGLGLPLILPRSLTGPQILRAIREGRPTVVIGVPRLYRALYDGIAARAAEQGLVAGLYFRSALALSTWLARCCGLAVGKRLLAPVHRQFGPTLRILASGGSALDPELAWKLTGLGWQVAIGYGLTETSPLLTLKLPADPRLHTVGRPVAGVEIKIAPLAGVPAGSGEVLARGPNVFAGYRNLPDQTAVAFTEDGWFRTGDLGRLEAENFLVLQGRASTMIVTESGENIQPDDLEEKYAIHPLIAEIGILEQRGRLAGLIVPDQAAIRRQGRNSETAVREAVREVAAKMPSYQRLAEYAVSREALPRTRLGKIRRHLLPERYRLAREEKIGADGEKAGPIPPSEMSDRDRALLEEPVARMVWDWLAHRYPEARLTPDTSLQFDLGTDSLEWLNLTMEIGQRTGVELGDEAIGRIDTVRDLLREMSEQATGGGPVDPERPLTRPEEVLSREQQRWLEPLGPGRSLLRRLAFSLNRLLLRSCFRLTVHGRENLPLERPFVLAPNHVSVIDPFVVVGAMPLAVLRRTFFAGWTGIAFANPLFRFGSRLAQAVPIDPRHAASSSLAFGAAVLKRGHNLVWFPEGERSADGRLGEFKPGLGLLLKHHPATVVPTLIQGAYESMPRGRRWPLCRRITITFGPPVETRELLVAGEGSEQDRISRALHRRVAELAAAG
jgi:long-chain acyl-CoA synthetase